MDATIITMVVGLTGILSTLISSSVGHYFTAKARASSLRQFLYSKQVDLIVELFHQHGRFKIFSTLLVDRAYLDKADPDMRNCIHLHSKLLETAGAILPTEVFALAKQLGSLMVDFLCKLDEEKTLGKDDMVEFTALEVKFALLSRSLIGADELTEQNISLIANKKDFSRLSDLEEDYLKAFTRKKFAEAVDTSTGLQG